MHVPLDAHEECVARVRFLTPDAHASLYASTMMHVRACSLNRGKIFALMKSVPRSSVEELKTYMGAYGPAADAHKK